MSRKPNGKEIPVNPMKPDPNWRKNSSSTMSSESFCSSSGVSSSSSQLCVNEEVTEEEVTPGVDEAKQPFAQFEGFVNVSTVTVNEQHSEIDEKHQTTLRINLVSQASLEPETSDSPSSPPAPPLPNTPPPNCRSDTLTSEIPIIKTQEPTPQTTPVTPLSMDLADDFIETDDNPKDLNSCEDPASSGLENNMTNGLRSDQRK